MAPGSSGQQVLARTNAFELKWRTPQNATSTGYVYHYDVISPLWDLKGREWNLGKNKGTELVMRLQQETHPDIFNPLGAYDGKKNLFSFKQYERVTSSQFTVPWEARPRRPKDVSIKMVFVKRIDVGSLKQLVAGDQKSLHPDSDAATALNMLNLYLQSTPRMKDQRVSNAKSFFTPDKKRSSPKIRPVELWRGYFQSARPALGKMIVNIDVTVGPVIPPLRLEQICAEYLGLNNLRGLSRLEKPNIAKLRLFMRGLKVEVILPGHSGKRPKTIKDIVPNVGAIMFEKDGERISVAEHFKRAHNEVIHPDSLGVRLGQDGLFPISVCKTTQQLLKNRSSPEVVREALDFSPPNPKQRLEAITAGWQQLCYAESPFLLGAGIAVNPDPLQVRGRILPQLEISFARDEKLMPRRRGQWDIMRKILFEAASLRNWTVVDFAACEMPTLSSFVGELTRAMGERGLNIAPSHNIVRADAYNYRQALDAAGREANATMILVILPESAAGLYCNVKRYGDITQGVVTQCVKWSGKLANDVRNKRSDQYCNNLILKINAKLGGTNTVPKGAAMEFLRKMPTMILGADVSHPGPGSHLPSIAALVASVDSQLSKYVAAIRVQETRTEMIDDLTDMFEMALKVFSGRNQGHLPRRIFMFRDGVSEGEFSIVRDKELSAMRVSIERAYGAPANWPSITFVIVGKRHHFRFFPSDRQSEDEKGNGNLHAGFVVDQDITHPVYNDFYLQSQPGLKGTSRPSHYTVITDSLKLPLDQLQQITYALCHCYSRATRSVKIPAPVYYADLVCRRAKFHFAESVKVDDLDSVSANTDERPHLDYYKANFTAINERLKDHMYFV